MLKPTKYSHPDRTVVYESTLLLDRIMKNRIDSYDDLLSFVKNKVIGGDVLFLPSLNFLFLLGLVEYHRKTDSFEYVGPNEAI